VSVDHARALPYNLRRLRALVGLTQTDAAAKAGLSRVAYRRLEEGESEPRASTLEGLKIAFDVPLAELFRPVLPPRRVRFRSEGGALRTRQQILDEVEVKLAAHHELESLLGIRRKPFPLGRRTGTDALRAVVRVRAAFGIAAGEPIRDICGLLEANGVTVLTDRVRAPGFFGLSVADGPGAPAVVVNVDSAITVERWIFTAAHELGHLVLHHEDFRADGSDAPASHEHEADDFASHFLMPDGVFWRAWDESRGLPVTRRVLKLKRMFRVSWRTVLHRAALREGQDVWTLFDRGWAGEGGRRLSRKDEPRPLEVRAFRSPVPALAARQEPERLSSSDFEADRLHLLVRNALEKALITRSRAAEILGISPKGLRELTAGWTPGRR
jgi:Zn-dependent peptidase ImmA (M78 family)/transcriptional regulator with XRE-family HTH domain